MAAIGDGDDGGGGETRVAVAVRRRWVGVVNDGGGGWRSVDQFGDAQTKCRQKLTFDLDVDCATEENLTVILY